MNKGLMIGGVTLATVLLVVAIVWTVKRAKKRQSLVAPLSLLGVSLALGGGAVWAGVRAPSAPADSAAAPDEIKAIADSAAEAGGSALGEFGNLANSLVMDAAGRLRQGMDYVTGIVTPKPISVPQPEPTPEIVGPPPEEAPKSKDFVDMIIDAVSPNGVRT